MNRTGKEPEIPPCRVKVSCVVHGDDIVMESPVWCPLTRRLISVGIQHKVVHILSPSAGTYQTYHLPELVTSVSTRAAGGLVLTLHKNFAFFDPQTQHLQRLLDPEPDRAGNRFNDGKCDRQGRLWAGTMGEKDWLARQRRPLPVRSRPHRHPHVGPRDLLERHRLEPGRPDHVLYRELPLRHLRL